MLFFFLSSYIIPVFISFICVNLRCTSLVCFRSFTWMTVVHPCCCFALCLYFSHRILSLICLHYFLRQKWYKLCVRCGSCVQSSVHSIQITKLYSQQNLWHQMANIFTSISPKYFDVLTFSSWNQKGCRNLTLKQKDVHWNILFF
jgi:hypothetical protein